MNRSKSILLTAIIIAIALTFFSCSGDDNDDGANSSNSIGNGNIFCQTDNACVAVSAEACLELGGKKVNSCENISLSSSSVSGGGNSSVGGSSSADVQGSSSSSSGSGSSNEDLQVFNRDDNSRYTGSGVIVAMVENTDDARTFITVGSVTNGIVNLHFSEAIPDKYLKDTENCEYQEGCEISPKDVKTRDFERFRLNDMQGKTIGRLHFGSMDRTEFVWYFYSTKAATIESYFGYGGWQGEWIPDYDSGKYRISVKAGWNKFYYKRGECTSYDEYGECICEIYEYKGFSTCILAKDWDTLSTENIFTKDVKWYLELE